MAGHCADKFAGEAVGIGRIIQFYIVDMNALFREALGEMAHAG